MDNKTLKIEFGNLAVVNNFIYAFGGWYMQFDECIQILELQKSRFGNYYILNIKIMIQDLFGQKYQINKELINRSCGHIDSNETAEFSKFLDLDNQISDDERLLGLKNLFFQHIMPFTKKMQTNKSIVVQINNGSVKVMPIIFKNLQNIIQ